MNPSHLVGRAGTVGIVGAVGAALLLAGCASARTGAAGGSIPHAHSGVAKHAAEHAAASSPLCAAFRSDELGKVGSVAPDRLAGALQAWERVSVRAPLAIRSDVGVVAGYLDHLAAGQPDPVEAHRIGASLGHITTWITVHCG
jgi:hypothetical protein